MAREINLVPDIKNEMIKTLKMRNLILFLSIIVASVSVGVTLITAFIMLGQQMALESKNNTINNLSEKLNSYSDLKDFLTIKDQLGDINQLTSNKRVLSRTFNILSAIIPNGADTIRISELNVDLVSDSPTFNFEAQANAGQEPYIDYNVLEAFKKSMSYMRYDYGRYVDKDGNEIPAYCMIEKDDDGSIFGSRDDNLYALWTIDEEGCTPKEVSNSNSDESTNTTNTQTTTYEGEENYKGKRVVRIWRTPQFADWYNEKNDQSRITLDGTISNVPHFESSCISYTGFNDPNFAPAADENVVKKIGNITWVSKNSECKLVPNADGEEGISIYDSSNGRNENGELVLRFSSTITFDGAVFDFNNYHMLALAPSGRRNVTDSFVQLQKIFTERATDCAPGDTSCANTSQGSGTNNSTNNSTDNNNNTNDSTNSGREQNG